MSSKRSYTMSDEAISQRRDNAARNAQRKLSQTLSEKLHMKLDDQVLVKQIMDLVPRVLDFATIKQMYKHEYKNEMHEIKSKHRLLRTKLTMLKQEFNKFREIEHYRRMQAYRRAYGSYRKQSHGQVEASRGAFDSDGDSVWDIHSMTKSTDSS